VVAGVSTSNVFVYQRTCVRCKQSKPMHGAITTPKFICAQCRQKAERARERREQAAACST
jgi:rRNA maturation endonuclease Nob1